MVIEINEIVVKASTGDDPYGSYPSEKSQLREQERDNTREISKDLEKLKQQILLECREMVLEIFQNQMER
ncbi:DUF5908 family protein [Desulfobacula phenolica]|uniref:Uncharacterized protein n=1 Tax=Desulfobacula phenolica TaxID=90732 RepID=A0A1H2JPD6_9BACT|nr:DUF5908 family protein [Desulfobacula phenolica]SDU58270.1 hypothetical protein SAMN04487931_11413 [Desulfobacula phenolica]